MPYVSILALGLLAAAAGIALYRWRAQLAAIAAQPLVVPGLIVGLGLVVRMSLLAATRLHADEALYSSWGLLIASGRDVFLRTVVVDKPPLLPYTLALSFRIFGPTEVAARLPNLMASVAAIGVLYGLAARLYGRRVAALSALVLALSPFDIQFGPTAFTDPLMVSLGLGACLLALSGHFVASGLALGLAFATKPTAVFFLPPVLLLAGVCLHRQGRPLALPRAWLALGAGPAAVIAVVAYWDTAIRVEQPGVMVAQASHYYGGTRLVALPELLPRLRGWLALSRFFTASALLNALLLAGSATLLARALLLWRQREDALFDGILVAYASAFLVAHTVVGFGVWDRYLLPLVPVVALLLARIVLLPLDLLPLPSRAQGACGALAALFLTAALLRPAGVALRHGFPLGSDDGHSQGIEDVAAYVKGSVPPDAILFHQALGWQFSFYMFGFPQEFQYYPDAAYLLDFVQHAPSRPKYIVFGTWLSSAEEEAALASGGWALEQVYHTYRPDGSTSFIVYRIERRS